MAKKDGLEKYRKIGVLGTGATAEVFLVEEETSKRKYAMKVSKKSGLLRKEAEWMLRLDCEIFPEIKEYFEGDREYLVMEYIEGMTLQELLDKGHKFDKRAILHIMKRILNGLDDLHKYKPALIYRDLKPANIMIEKNGRVRMLDLGTVQVEQEKGTTRAGTYGYAAPEQFWQGMKLTRTCDIYAAGKLFAYLLTGKNPAEPPYDIENYCKGLRGMHPAYKEVVKRCLAVEPQGRFEDCESLMAQLQRAYDEDLAKKLFIFHKKTTSIYKKCIWKSEYRRIF